MGNYDIEKTAASTGIELAKARSIWVQFSPYFKGAEEAAAKVANLVITDESQKDEMALARKIRLELRDIRIAAKQTHDDLKADILKEGKFIDATFNLIADTTKPIEAELKEKEEYAKRKEAERIARLVADRKAALNALEVDVQFLELAKLSEDVFCAMLQKSERAYVLKKEAERKAEEVRLAAEKAAAEERARIEAENARLRAEAAERARQLAEERVKVEAERRARDEADRREREARDAALRAEQEKQREALRKAQEERERVERELKAKQEAEERARQEEVARVEAQRQAEEAELQRLAAASDKEKLAAYLDAVMTIEVPSVSSDAANGIVMMIRNSLKLCIARVEDL